MDAIILKRTAAALCEHGFVLDGDPLGRGGFSVVLPCKAVATGRLFAAKVLSLTASHPLFEKFRQAKQLVGLEHPNLVRLERHIEDPPILVTQRCKQDLAAYLAERGGTLPLGEALDVTLQLASALDFLRVSAQRAHLDVKPENVLTNGQGHVWLGDYELGPRITETKGVGLTAAIAATDLYRAPELLLRTMKDGKEGWLTNFAADVFSLVLVLFKIATGQDAPRTFEAGWGVSEVPAIFPWPIRDLLAAAARADRTIRPEHAGAFRERLLAAREDCLAAPPRTVPEAGALAAGAAPVARIEGAVAPAGPLRPAALRTGPEARAHAALEAAAEARDPEAMALALAPLAAAFGEGDSRIKEWRRTHAALLRDVCLGALECAAQARDAQAYAAAYAAAADRLALPDDCGEMRLYRADLATFLPALLGCPLPGGFSFLGTRRFTCPNEVEGEKAYVVPVFRCDAPAQALVETPASRESDATGPWFLERLPERVGEALDCEFVWLPPVLYEGWLPDGGAPAPFLIARTLLTQRVVQAGKGPHGEFDWKGALQPANQVSWNEVSAWLAEIGLRLPGEKEWEFGCRGGTKTVYCCGNAETHLGRHARYEKNAQGRTWPVAVLRGNAFGLADTHGNLWEWCSDAFSGAADRVIRGGDFAFDASDCSSALRDGWDPSGRYSGVGCRPASSP